MPDVAEIKTRLNDVFRDVFDDDDIEVAEGTSAPDIDGWDSLTHITLVIAVEREFKIRMTAVEVGALKNVGQLIDLISAKLA